MSRHTVPVSSESPSPTKPAPTPASAPTVDPSLAITAFEQGRPIVGVDGATLGLPTERLTRVAQLGEIYGLSDPTTRLQSLYDELRQARVAGCTEVLARVMPGDGALAEAMDLRPVPGASHLVGQRLDIAIARAAAAIETSALPSLEPKYLAAEVGAHLEAFFARIQAGRWFRAVYDKTITRGQYVYTLSNMHQFVRFTTRILGRCVANAQDSELRRHFALHLSEEVNHELIIERDLAALGEDVDFVREKMAPNLPTRQFMAAQESAIAFHRDPILLMAAPLAAEGISGHLDGAFLDALHEVARGWGVSDPTRVTRFYSSHMDYDGGDDGHWESTVAMLSTYLTDETKLSRFLSVLAATTHAMEQCYDSWIADIQLS